MSHSSTLIRYTTRSLKIKDSPARLDAAKKAAEKAGEGFMPVLDHGKVRRRVISEFPNDEEARNSCWPRGVGNVTTQTMESLYRRGISQNRRFAVRGKQPEGLWHPGPRQSPRGGLCLVKTTVNSACRVLSSVADLALASRSNSRR